MLVRVGLFVSTATVPVVSSIASFSLAAATKASGCNPLQSVATWTISNPNNTDYKLVILENGAEFACASTVGTTLTGTQGYGDGATSSEFITFTLQVVRRSDSFVMSSLSATSVAPAVLVGPVC